MTDERRKQPDLATLHGKMDALMEQTQRQNVALFATDSSNEFGTPGVMTVMQKMDRHIDFVCAYAKAAKKAVKWMVGIIGGIGTVAGAIAAGQAAGWW